MKLLSIAALPFVAIALWAADPSTVQSAPPAVAPPVRPTPTPVPSQCHAKSVTVSTLYGKAGDVMRHLSEMPSSATASRIQLFTVETAEGAEVLLLERTGTGLFQVSQWKGSSLGNLRAVLDEKILASRGRSCAGEDTKTELISRGFSLTESGSVDHQSAAATFRPVVERQGGGFMRVSYFCDCN